MTTLENILEYFKVKTHFIIFKHSVSSPVPAYSYSQPRMSSGYGNFNNKMKEVDEELSNATVGILQRFQYEENVDFDGLMEGLYKYKTAAKLEFMQMNRH